MSETNRIRDRLSSAPPFEYMGVSCVRVKHEFDKNSTSCRHCGVMKKSGKVNSVPQEQVDNTMDPCMMQVPYSVQYLKRIGLMF